MSFREFVTLLCGCLIVLAIASTGTAQGLTCNYNVKTKTCGGSCPLGQTCAKIAGTSICQCQLPPTCANNPKGNTCGGKCPPGQTCAKLHPGSEVCGCQQFTCGYNANTKTCGGTCPYGKTCKKDPATKCGCH
jgi:hypothetical protein